MINYDNDNDNGNDNDNDRSTLDIVLNSANGFLFCKSIGMLELSIEGNDK